MKISVHRSKALICIFSPVKRLFQLCISDKINVRFLSSFSKVELQDIYYSHPQPFLYALATLCNRWTISFYFEATALWNVDSDFANA